MVREALVPLQIEALRAIWTLWIELVDRNERPVGGMGCSLYRLRSTGEPIDDGNNPCDNEISFLNPFDGRDRRRASRHYVVHDQASRPILQELVRSLDPSLQAMLLAIFAHDKCDESIALLSNECCACNRNGPHDHSADGYRI